MLNIKRGPDGLYTVIVDGEEVGTGLTMEEACRRVDQTEGREEPGEFTTVWHRLEEQLPAKDGEYMTITGKDNDFIKMFYTAQGREDLKDGWTAHHGPGFYMVLPTGYPVTISDSTIHYWAELPRIGGC